METGSCCRRRGEAELWLILELGGLRDTGRILLCEEVSRLFCKGDWGLFCEASLRLLRDTHLGMFWEAAKGLPCASDKGLP